MSVKKTQDPIIVTPPKPLPIPSPTYSLEEGEQGTSEAEVVTEPNADFFAKVDPKYRKNGIWSYDFQTATLEELQQIKSLLD